MLAKSFLPMTAVLEMTYDCNHACKFCSCHWYKKQGHKTSEMDVSEWKELITEFCEAGVCCFAFTGGEALMKDGLIDIIRYAAQSKAFFYDTVDGELVERIDKPDLFLLSNGKIVDDEILDLCSEHKIHLSFSLPGLETFEEITQSGVSSDHILELFTRAKAKGVTTTAGITVTKLNFDELYDNISAALVAGADTILLNRFMPGGRGLKNRELELSLEQIKQIPIIADEILTLAKRNGHIGTELPFCIANPKDFETLVSGSRCSAASDFFVVSPNGQLRVCNHSEVELVNWRDWRDLQKHPYWNKFIFKDWIPEGCEGCDKLGSKCDGGCREAAHVANGSVNSPDPLWQGTAPYKQCSI